MNNPQKSYENLGAIHRQSLAQSLQRRLEVARSKGDEKLISQLEAEAKYLKINS